MSAGFNKPNAILGLGLVAAGGAALLANQRQRGVRKQFPKRQRREDRQFVIDMISGGVGEAVQAGALYPLDTIRVKCQSDTISTAEAIRALVRADAPLKTLRHLYAGFAPYVVSAAVFGSLYFALYAGLKRFGDDQMASLAQRGRRGGPAASPASVSAAAISAQHGHHAVQHTPSSSGGASSSGKQQRQEGKKGAASAPDAGAKGTAESLDSDLGGSGMTSSLAALSATWLTSLIEGPADHFKQMVQVSHTNGSGGVSTWHVIKGLFKNHGIKGVYSGYFPFLVGQIPYDAAEYFSYSQLINARNAFNQTEAGKATLAGMVYVLGGGGRRPVAVEVVEGVQDCLLGAVAGLAAVVTATPFEVVRSKILAAPGGGEIGMRSPGGVLAEFVKVGKETVQTRGPRALFTGLAPRMAEAVPASALYWVAMQFTRRALMRLDAAMNPDDALSEAEEAAAAASGAAALSVSDRPVKAAAAVASASASAPPPPSEPPLDPLAWTVGLAAAAAAATAAAVSGPPGPGPDSTPTPNPASSSSPPPEPSSGPSSPSLPPHEPSSSPAPRNPSLSPDIASTSAPAAASAAASASASATAAGWAHAAAPDLDLDLSHLLHDEGAAAMTALATAALVTAASASRPPRGPSGPASPRGIHTPQKPPGGGVKPGRGFVGPRP